MGRNNRAKRERAGQATNGRGTFTDEPMNVDNPAFSKFYGSGIIPPTEWNQCLECFRTALPTSFRFNTSLPNAVALRDHVTSYLRELGQQLTPLAFVPNSMAFQTASSRGEIKRNAANKAVKQLMHVLNEEGYLSRQEAVSMIPPLLLDVQPGHRVIDMCAAPGSKTTQILESLVRQGPGGVVVANDVNQGRLDVLNHQTARLPDAKSRLIVTNHDATAFPLVTSAEHKFDRVLCDVMCSGDGTLRKSMDLWARWNPLLGPHLHIQQSRVLLRGMGLCKVGGIVVYSTCSMNPAEDEAVIARCLEEVGGAFELIDPHPILSQLKYYKGLHEWRLMNADASVELHQYSDSRPTTVNRDANQTSSNAEAAVEANHPDASRQQAKGKSRFTFTPSMFPPPAARAAEMKLERCVRVAPHLQDTGGFFIAALRCVSELPKSVSSTGVGKYGDSPIRPLPAELAKEVATRMKLSDAFPMHRLFTASTEDSRNPKVYYLSEDCANMMSTMNAKLIQAGVKVFESNVKRSWAHLRIASDGAATLARVFPECVTRCNAEAVLKHFMSHSDGEVVRWPVDDFKSTIAVEPAAFDVSRGHGIAELHCGTWLGCVYLPMEVSHGTVYIRASRTQLSLLKLGHGVPLVAPGEDAADSDSDSNSGDGLEESAPARPQPAVE